MTAAAVTDAAGARAEERAGRRGVPRRAPRRRRARRWRSSSPPTTRSRRWPGWSARSRPTAAGLAHRGDRRRRRRPRRAPRERAAEAGALVCDVPVNRGQGAALRLGYWLARAARGAGHRHDRRRRPVRAARAGRGRRRRSWSGRADFVSGSRRLGRELTTDPVRRLGVRVFGALISAMVGHRITDPACGIRAMRAELTAAVVLEQPQYQASELMISAARHGFRLAEVPTTMRDRGQHATAHQEGREPRLRPAVRPRRAPHLVAGPQRRADAAAPGEHPAVVGEELQRRTAAPARRRRRA